jgi:hypothetical protein
MKDKEILKWVDINVSESDIDNGVIVEIIKQFIKDKPLAISDTYELDVVLSELEDAGVFFDGYFASKICLAGDILSKYFI